MRGVNRLHLFLISCAFFGLAACGSVLNTSTTNAVATFTVSGTISGLEGSGLILQGNSGVTVPVSANGPFTAATGLVRGATYAVTVSAQPSSPSQTCAVTHDGTGTVGAANVTGVTVVCTTNTYSVGGEVSGLVGSGLALRDNGADYLTMSTSGSFIFATALASGSAYSVTAFTQPNSPNQHCVIAGGTGTVTNANVTNVSVICRTDGRFVYVANNSNDVSAFTMDSTTGALAAVTGSPFAAGTGPTSVAVDPGGRFAYAVNGVDGTISAYTINAGTGALTRVAGSPFTVGANPQSVTVDPSGHFVYVANFDDNDVSAFTINATTGALTAVAGSPFAADANAKFVTVEPTGRFAYVLNDGSRDVSVYSIDGTTGVLTELLGSPYSGVTGSGPFSMAITPNGQFAYVANNDGSNHISAFSINAVSGAPTVLADSPFFGVNVPWSVVIDPSGEFVYVVDKGTNEISGYTINAVTGDLTRMTGSPFATGINPRSIAVDPSGQFAYVGNADSGDVSVYTIDATTGDLTSVVGGPFLTGTGPVSIAISK